MNSSFITSRPGIGCHYIMLLNRLTTSGLSILNTWCYITTLSFDKNNSVQFGLKNLISKLRPHQIDFLILIQISFEQYIYKICLKLYRQIVGISMGTNCAPLDADLFLFCYVRDFMLTLSDNNQTDIIEAFNSTSRYLDDLLNIDYTYS